MDHLGQPPLSEARGTSVKSESKNILSSGHNVVSIRELTACTTPVQHQASQNPSVTPS